MLCLIAGGAAVYAEALPLADRLYLTEILADVPGDTFFPPFDKETYDQYTEDERPGGMSFRYTTYIRKKNAAHSCSP